jgi:hypothetical protein
LAERIDQGIQASIAGHCTVSSEPPNPANPTGIKQRFAATTGYSAIGFSIADFVYFGYGLTSGGGWCGWSANTAEIYTLFALGDLDGDKNASSFELAVGSDSDNTLFHARGFYIVNELE